MSDPDKQRGLYRKYELRRVNEDGSLRYVVADPFFVLRYTTDPHARVALEAYADSCRDEYPVLADDLYHALGIRYETNGFDLTEELSQILAEHHQGHWVAIRKGNLIACGETLAEVRANAGSGFVSVLYVRRDDEKAADDR